MKIKAIKVLEIEGLGLFKEESSWNNLTNYVQINGQGSFIAKNEDITFGLLASSTFIDELEIILASENIIQKIKKIHEIQKKEKQND